MSEFLEMSFWKGFVKLPNRRNVVRSMIVTVFIEGSHPDININVKMLLFLETS